jgi:hypothetical protein
MKMTDGNKGKEGLEKLLYQLLETELGGVQVYKAAIACTVNEELREEWKHYLEETENHVRIARDLLQELGLDPDADVTARRVVRHLGEALVETIQLARDAGDPDAAQIVAAECVVEAETKDHLNWELLGFVAQESKGKTRKAVERAYEQIEDQEDRHLYHTTGWTRELWLESLGLAAVLPPPEEEKQVKTAIGAARAKKSRSEML